MPRWSRKDSLSLYNVEGWSNGYFSINQKGNVVVRPAVNIQTGIDLKNLIDDLKKRKIKPPILLRFMNILENRIFNLIKSFQNAIDENNYPGSYQIFYPIKVNQQRQVVEAIAKYGKKYNTGIEVGSKPEMTAALSVTASQKNTPIICNGYKDYDLLEIILFAKKIGHNITIVIEKVFELENIIKLYKKYKIKPQLGIRVKLSSKGSGKWASSGGNDAKFGLNMSEILPAIDLLKQNDLVDCLELLHFHIGSQVTKVEKIKNALNEGTRLYVALRKMNINIKYIDIGGGLGIDYDGSNTSSNSSLNYTLDEYASNVIFQIKSICEETNTICPNIISESGRALAAHYSVLITNLLHTDSKYDTSFFNKKIELDEKSPPTIKKLYDIYLSMDKHSLIEDYHDNEQLYNEAISLFNLGYLNLFYRAQAEILYNKIIKKIYSFLEKQRNISDELEQFKLKLKKTVFLNFSIFQSIPDAWAIKQLFPIMPIQRLNEKPNLICSIADVTCDSDGEISHFVGAEGEEQFLPLHNVSEKEDYYIGFFLTGAYQEILGDMHNLFGDPNAVHIRFHKKSGYKIETVIPAETISETLKYVQYNGQEILKCVRDNLEPSVSSGKISIEESRHYLDLYEKSLNSFTYLS